MKKEIWKEIREYKGKYLISNYGNVKKIVCGKEKEVTKCKNKKGYLSVYLYDKGKLKNYKLHRLVACYFLDKNDYNCMPYEDKNKIDKNKLQINHKDENKENNHADNLEWCTCSYNINYGDRNIKHSKKMSKKVRQYDLNGNFIKEWNSLIEIQRKTGISIGTIYRVHNKKPYKGYYWYY